MKQKFEEKTTLLDIASKFKIILFKDYIKHIQDDTFIDEDGQIFEDVQKVFYQAELCAYYIPDGYKSINCYLKPTAKGLSSQYKYLNKICFDIGFLNKNTDFENLKTFIDLVCVKYYDKNKIKPNRNYLYNILTLGTDTPDNLNYDYSYKKYFYLKNYTKEMKRQIALTNNGKVKRSKSMDKINQALDILMLSNQFISYRKLATQSNLSFPTVNRLINKQIKEVIKGHNREKTGYPTHNEYIRGKNEDAIIKAYQYLKNKNYHTTITNLAKYSKVYRTTVSKIMKDKDFIKFIEQI